MPQEPPLLYRIKIAGEAGDGIMTAGDILMKSAARQGYTATVVKSFPSNIRGGYSEALVTIADIPITSPLGESNVLFLLSPDALSIDTFSLEPSTIILVEATALSSPLSRERFDSFIRNGCTVFSVPVQQFARETAGSSTIRSTVVLGILGELLGIKQSIISSELTDRFAIKGKDVVELNHIALESGFLWAQQHLNGAHTYSLPYCQKATANKELLVLDGNQAVALGALAAGCTFFASYPITPATAIGEVIARHITTLGGFAYQAEDEIAALGSVIGASFYGRKAMTTTSGPGLSLMQEFIGYASMTEIPAVVVDVQRVGPSTGMPTKHSQDDLHAAVFGGHGEGQRIVLAPIDVEDCFHCTLTAFNCSERYQCPVIVLSDSALGMTRSVVNSKNLQNTTIINREVYSSPYPDQSPFLRYRLSDSGINPMTVPGVSPITYRATGVEHDENSTPLNTPEKRTLQMKKRFRKLLCIEKEIEAPVIWDCESEEGAAPSDVALCAWGFTAGITREAVYRLRKEGIRVAALYPRLLFPVCIDAVNRWAKLSTIQIVIEANFTGQYTALIKMATDARPIPLTVSRGEPFTPQEITSGVMAILEQRVKR